MSTTVFDLFTADGSQATFTYTFALLGTFSDVRVKTRPPTDENFTQMTEGIQYTLDKTNSQITFDSDYIPVNLTIVRIERYTNRERQIDFISGSTLSEPNLDNDANRLTSVDQELEAGINNCLKKNDAGTAWNGEGLPSENCGPAVDPDGWVTLAQLQGILEGGQVGEVSGATVLTYTGDGLTTEFELDGMKGLTIELIDVYVEQVYQSADGTQYEVYIAEDSRYPTAGDGDDYLAFDVAPPDGAKVEVKVISGTVLMEITDFSITTTKLADDAVTLAKINVGAAAEDTRFLVCDEDGDPVARRISLADAINSGTIAANALANLKAQLRVSDFADPNADIAFGGTYLLTGLRTPSSAQDAARKGYVDAQIADLAGQIGGLALTTASGLVTATQMPEVPGSTHRVDCGFRPDLVIALCPQVTVALVGSFTNAFGIYLRHAEMTIYEKANLWGSNAHAKFSNFVGYLASAEVTPVQFRMGIGTRNAGHEYFEFQTPLSAFPYGNTVWVDDVGWFAAKIGG